MSLLPTLPDWFNRSPAFLDGKCLHDHRKGFVALGAIAAVLGLVALALMVSATNASVLLIGRSARR